MTERICTTCGSSKSANDFPKDPHGRDGRRSRCKVCHSAAAKQRYQSDPTVRERYVAAVRARTALDPEAARAYAKAQYESHREARLSKQRARTDVLRAERAGVPIETGISVSKLRERDGDRCCYCECPLDFSPNIGRQFRPDLATIDHIVPLSRGGGHTWDNVGLACWGCNVAKRDRTAVEWQASQV